MVQRLRLAAIFAATVSALLVSTPKAWAQG